jgi:coenzyme F420-reducing hydrogenase delta subunit
MANMDAGSDEPRVIIFACDQGNAEILDDEALGIRVIKLPCVGMLPPSFVDFALSRRYADGVMLAGCPENDCFHRLGNEWTIRRMARERDPYLRQRVPEERVAMAWLPPGAHRRRASALREFRANLRGLRHE